MAGMYDLGNQDAVRAGRRLWDKDVDIGKAA